MFAVVRVRGTAGKKKKVNDALKMLRLTKANHCVVVPETPEHLGMLKEVKDYVAYGSISKEMLVELLKERGRLLGDKLITDEWLKLRKFGSIEKLADALMNGKIKMKDLKGMKPLFRLNPPRKGYKSVRLPYPKGDLGFRKEMDGLLKRMM